MSLNDPVWYIESRAPRGKTWKRHIPGEHRKETCERQIRDFFWQQDTKRTYRIVNVKTQQVYHVRQKRCRECGCKHVCSVPRPGTC